MPPRCAERSIKAAARPGNHLCVVLSSVPLLWRRHELRADGVMHRFTNDVIYFIQCLEVEMPAHYIVDWLELAWMPGAPECHRYAGLIENPADGQCEHGFAVALAGEFR